MSQRLRVFLVNLPLTFGIYLVVVYLWDRGNVTDWPTTLFRGAIIALAVSTGTTLAQDRNQHGK